MLNLNVKYLGLIYRLNDFMQHIRSLNSLINLGFFAHNYDKKFLLNFIIEL